jgi:hypothetical protein
MGYEHYGKGSDPQRVFEALRAESREIYGSNGHSGQIALATGVQVIQSKPLPPGKAKSLAQAIFDDIEHTRWPRLSFIHEKNDHAGAIAVCTTGVTKRERTVKVKIDVTADELHDTHELVEKAAKAKIKLTERDHIGRVKVEIEKKVPQFEAIVAPGKAVRKWRVVGFHSRSGDTYTIQRAGLHDTRAKARAAAKALMTDDPYSYPRLAVEQVGFAADGVSAIEQIKLRSLTVHATATVEIERLPADAKIDGWLLIGTARH